MRRERGFIMKARLARGSAGSSRRVHKEGRGGLTGAEEGRRVQSPSLERSSTDPPSSLVPHAAKDET